MKDKYIDAKPNLSMAKTVFQSDFIENMVENAELKIYKKLEKNNVFKTKTQYVLGL